MYVKTSRTGRSILIPVFVDDVFPASATVDLEEMMFDLHSLATKYGIKEIVDADVILGMRVTRDRAARTLVLDQEVYLQKMLEQHRMQDSKGVATPEVARIKGVIGTDRVDDADRSLVIRAVDAASNHIARALERDAEQYGSVTGAIL